MKKIWLFFFVFLVLVSSAYASDCNISIDITTSKPLYSNETIDFRFKLSDKTSDYKIEYWVEDSLGEIVKSKRNTTNLNKKSFTPKLSGINIFKIRARFVELDCINSIQNISEHILFFIGDTEEEQCCACTTKKGLDYFVVEQQKEIFSGREFKIRVNFTNHDLGEHDVSVWSYVYRGSKVYSISRKANEHNFSLDLGESRIIELPILVDAEPGDYKIKVKIKKDNQKTDYEMKWDVAVTESEIFDEKHIKIESTSFTIDPTRVIAIINNTFEKDFFGEVQLHSAYGLDKVNTIIEQGDENLVSFDADALDYTNPFFVKLIINDTLIDIEEIILTNPQKKQDKPFNLVTGDIILEDSTIIYESSSMKSFKLILYLLLVLSIAVNCWFIYNEKKI